MARLNLGSGEYPLENWTNIDVEDVDLSVRPWPWADDSIEAINASHILEHFTKANGFLFLLQCWRILKPGGELRLAVPDMDKVIACKLSDNYEPLDGYKWTSLDDLLGGNSHDVQATEYDKHRYMYCEASLAWTLDQIGFERIQREHIPNELDNPRFAAISLYMQAVKP